MPPRHRKPTRFDLGRWERGENEPRRAALAAIAAAGDTTIDRLTAGIDEDEDEAASGPLRRQAHVLADEMVDALMERLEDRLANRLSQLPDLRDHVASEIDAVRLSALSEVSDPH